MKTMKKLLSILLSAALLAALCSGMVFADETDPCEDGHTFEDFYIADGTVYTSDEFWGFTSSDSEGNVIYHSPGAYNTLPCETEYEWIYKCTVCGEIDDSEYDSTYHDYVYIYTYNGTEYDGDAFYGEYVYDEEYDTYIQQGGIYETLDCGDEYSYSYECKKCHDAEEKVSTVKGHVVKTIYVYDGEEYSDKQFYGYEYYDEETGDFIRVKGIYDTLPCEAEYEEIEICKYGDYSYDEEYTKPHDFSYSYIYNGETYGIKDFTGSWSYDEETGEETYEEGIIDTIKCGEEYTVVSVCLNCGEETTETWPKEHELETVYIYNGKEYSNDEFYGTWGWDEDGNYYEGTGIYDTIKCGEQYEEREYCLICDDYDETETYTKQHDSESVYVYDGKEYSSFDFYGYTSWTDDDEPVYFPGIADSLDCSDIIIYREICRNCGEVLSEEERELGHDYGSTSYYVYRGKTYDYRTFFGSYEYDFESGKSVYKPGIADELECGTYYKWVVECSRCDSTDSVNRYTNHKYDEITYVYNGSKYTDEQFMGTDSWDEKGNYTHIDGIYDKMKCGEKYRRTGTCVRCGEILDIEGEKEHEYDEENAVVIYNGKQYDPAQFYDSIYDGIPCGAAFTVRDTCSICGEEVPYEEIRPHKSDDFTYEWIETATGYKVRGSVKCSACGKTESAETDAENVWTVSVPTCTEKGRAYYYAYFEGTAIETTVELKEVPMIAHNVVNGICKICGEAVEISANGFVRSGDTWILYKDGTPASGTTGVVSGTINGESGWWYVVNGVADLTATTVASNSNGWWYIEKGKVNFNFTGFANNEYGRWRIEGGKVNFDYNDIVQDENEWRYYVGGLFQKNYTGVTDFGNNNGWWYVKNGVVDFTANTVAANKNGWWKVTGGRVDFNYKGLASNSNGWWYLEKGKVNFSANTVASNDFGWWKVTNGKVDFDFKGLASNDYGWWYLEGGKVNFNYTGYADNSYGRWRIENGKVNFNYNDIVYESGQWRYYYGGLFQKSYTGVTDCGNASGWWYVKNGVVDFTANTVAANKNGWWKVTNGRVDFSFTGIAENSYGRWYIENGRVNFSLTGTKVINGRAYKIAGGKVS